ncbi:hypothetical protein GQ55_9G257300 [Panicum hallii var. hallii]|uniref:Uncharacterized protein n=1 Tax=Panicum hallii var. hallii TaxID=1504633 RepID=A0A2T7C6Y4_9POAL|nr:hypothetical protein GQ55_9G257300 [Panicum hallii var. hallii]
MTGARFAAPGACFAALGGRAAAGARFAAPGGRATAGGRAVAGGRAHRRSICAIGAHWSATKRIVLARRSGWSGSTQERGAKRSAAERALTRDHTQPSSSYLLPLLAPSTGVKRNKYDATSGIRKLLECMFFPNCLEKGTCHVHSSTRIMNENRKIIKVKTIVGTP